ncbi:MAG: cyclic nucleotide-binding domain-containing protein [Deltaproteobacteria bacterium]|nr:cyclic nucleotide-binding domain-containing protein [Deltaproteobacteria bacterium]
MAGSRFVSPLERILFLRSLPWFDTLSMRDLALFARYASERSFPRGSLLIRDDEPVTSGHIVVEGRVRLTREGQLRPEPRVPGGVGFLDLLAGYDGGSKAEALEECVTLEIPAEALYSMMENNFAMVQGMFLNLAGFLLEARGNLPIRPEGAPAPQMGEDPGRALGLVDRLDLMTRGGPFPNVNLDALLPLARRLREVRHPPGTRLWARGEASTWVVNLLYGKVRCGTGEADATVEVGAGYGLGFMDALAGRKRAYWAETVTDVVGLAYDLTTLLHLSETYFDLTRSLLASIARALVEEELAQVGRGPASGSSWS